MNYDEINLISENDRKKHSFYNVILTIFGIIVNAKKVKE